ncbi:Uncharacterised protein [Photobacterium damselae]|uniref:Uncharacterized protein n=1 Tax=Photobacterium damselae TaxID=38293 RepID=A0A2X1XRL0_PHODM|nr:Uncharacterised protein [Photobacterium damselae]
MHDQRLRQQSFNKPPGLEQRLGLNVICSKNVPHQREGGDIKNGRRRANPQHKTADILRIPLARLAQKLFVHFVPRQRKLGEIVHQVLNQQMNRQHRQERNKRAGHQYREDVAEVRTGGHIQVLNDIAERLTSFDHPFFQHHQILFQQNDIRCLFGDIRRAVDRNADVRIAQGWRIVDAVAEKADGVAIFLQRFQDARLLQRRQLREYRARFHFSLQFAISHRFNLGAGQNTVGIDAHFQANTRRNHRVIAGQHFHRHAVIAQRVMAFPALSFGGSRKVSIPSTVSPCSSAVHSGVVRRSHPACGLRPAARGSPGRYSPSFWLTADIQRVIAFTKMRGDHQFDADHQTSYSTADKINQVSLVARFQLSCARRSSMNAIQNFGAMEPIKPAR